MSSNVTMGLSCSCSLPPARVITTCAAGVGLRGHGGSQTGRGKRCSCTATNQPSHVPAGAAHHSSYHHQRSPASLLASRTRRVRSSSCCRDACGARPSDCAAEADAPPPPPAPPDDAPPSHSSTWDACEHVHTDLKGGDATVAEPGDSAPCHRPFPAQVQAVWRRVAPPASAFPPRTRLDGLLLAKRAGADGCFTHVHSVSAPARCGAPCCWP